ncbi:MAG TPA: hypothetical protein VLV31_01465, partial [Candidatus Acidoferrales bacterium]|nr:hypothetical protein [Candidatus Acidoferrales bacterium]
SQRTWACFLTLEHCKVRRIFTHFLERTPWAGSTFNPNPTKAHIYALFLRHDETNTIHAEQVD